MVVSPQIRGVWLWYWLWHVAGNMIMLLVTWSIRTSSKTEFSSYGYLEKVTTATSNRDLICGSKMLTKHRYTTDWETADHWNATRRAVLAIYMPIIIAGSAGNLATCWLPHTHLAYQWTLPARPPCTLWGNWYQKGTKCYKSCLERRELNLAALMRAKVAQVVMEMGMDKTTFLSNFRNLFLINGVRIREFHVLWVRFLCVEQYCSS